MMVLDMAAQPRRCAVRFACLVHDLGKGRTPATPCARLRTRAAQRTGCARARPGACRVEPRAGDVVAREHGNIHRSGDQRGAVVRLLERCDAFRKPERFDELLLACECDAGVGWASDGCRGGRACCTALAAAQAVATDPIAREAQAAGDSGPKIGEAIRRARIAAVARPCWPATLSSNLRHWPTRRARPTSAMVFPPC